MKYITIEQAQEPLALWHAFAGEERVYWYNPVRKQTIFAAVRAKALDISPNSEGAEAVDAFAKEYPYTWISETFFPTTQSSVWADMGNEAVAFSYYYVQNQKAQLVSGDTQAKEAHPAKLFGGNVQAKPVHKDEQVAQLKKEPLSGQSAYWLVDEALADKNSFELNKKINFETVAIKHQYTMSNEDYGDWCTFFAAIEDTINSGKAVKIVASRAVELQGKEAFSIESMLQGLLQHNPSSFVFAYAKGDAVFIGATPEVLIQKEGQQMLSYALAGTIKKQGPVDDAAGQILLHDPKNCHEHGIVVDMIKSTMNALSPRVEAEAMGLMELKNLFHLRTIIRAHGGNPYILNWVHALHPTPAMGGQPREVALDLLAKKEPHERGLYAAPLGFLETKGDGTVDGSIVVGIRSALVKGNKAYAYAGCGIVGDSDCASEYEETKTKLGTILEVL